MSATIEHAATKPSRRSLPRKENQRPTTHPIRAAINPTEPETARADSKSRNAYKAADTQLMAMHQSANKNTVLPLPCCVVIGTDTSRDFCRCKRIPAPASGRAGGSGAESHVGWLSTWLGVLVQNRPAASAFCGAPAFVPAWWHPRPDTPTKMSALPRPRADQAPAPRFAPAPRRLVLWPPPRSGQPGGLGDMSRERYPRWPAAGDRTPAGVLESFRGQRGFSRPLRGRFLSPAAFRG